MNVLIFCDELLKGDEYYGKVGGVAIITRMLAEKLGQLGANITVIFNSSKIDIASDETSGNVRIISIPRGIKTNEIGPLEGALRSWLISRYLIDRSTHHCSIAMGIKTLALAPLLLRQYEVPYVMTTHGGDVPFSMREKRIIDTFSLPLKRMYWSGSDYAIATSEDVKTRAERRLPSKDIEIIPYGVDIDKFCSVEVDYDEPNILYVGRLIPTKGVDGIIRAVASLSGNRKRIKLTICGDGPLKGELEELSRDLGIQEYVKFTGWIRHGDLPKVYGSSNIFVSYSSTESGPLTVLEAMASGLAVVATRVGMARDVLSQNGSEGYLVNPDDIGELTGKLYSMCSMNSTSLRQLGRHNRVIANNYSWDKFGERYMKSLREHFGFL